MRILPSDYEPRWYRDRQHPADLVTFGVAVKETDLWISADRNLEDEALAAIKEQRHDLETYIARDRVFLTTLKPHPVPSTAPPIAQDMARAAAAAGVGPMAAVAGAMAEAVGRRLLDHSRHVLVENGGDIFLASAGERVLEVLVTEKSPFYKKLFIRVPPAPDGMGICTSSGLIGPSLSFGKSEAALVMAPDAALADAAATAVGNLVTDEAAVDRALAFARSVPGVTGALVVIGEKVGMWGSVELCE
jgi:ApbE superfamily uncharacterized protein (UPF0280 family)